MIGCSFVGNVKEATSGKHQGQEMHVIDGEVLIMGINE